MEELLSFLSGLSGYFVLFLVSIILVLCALFLITHKSYHENNTIIGSQNIEFARQVNNAESLIRIVSGELNKNVFDDKQIVEAFKNAATKGVDIQIIFGPDADQKMEILEISQYPNVQFFQSNSREENHFTLVDGSYYYSEAPHKPYAKIRKSKKEYNPRLSSIRAIINFNNIKKNSSAIYLEQ